jgi:hypothetical protein
MAPLALAVAAVVAAACMPKHGANTPLSLGATINQQMAATNAIRWSADRRLTWADFRGPVPASPGDEGARTAYSLFYGARCAGRRFEFRVVASVLPRESWVSPVVLQSPPLSARSLRHEQTHFDLSEVHARTMRQYFRDLAEPCKRSEEELNVLAQQFLRAESIAQRRYDEETNFGRISGKQHDWETEIGRQITGLNAFAEGR